MRENSALFSVRKIVLTALLLAVVAFALADLKPAEAVVIAGPHVCTYYSDGTYRTAVGARGTGCCNSTISWGVTSPYKRCERLYCTDVVCPD